jgi:hypothetical protein
MPGKLNFLVCFIGFVSLLLVGCFTCIYCVAQNVVQWSWSQAVHESGLAD